MKNWVHTETKNPTRKEMSAGGYQQRHIHGKEMHCSCCCSPTASLSKTSLCLMKQLERNCPNFALNVQKTRKTDCCGK